MRTSETGQNQPRAGGMLLYRGRTGHCDIYGAMNVDTVHTQESGLRIEKVVTVGLPPQQVYEFWRNLENLPRFMKHLESVHVTGERTCLTRRSSTRGTPSSRSPSTCICGSDLHLYNGLVPTMKKGDILGHEFVGEIVETGSGVSRFNVGDRPMGAIFAKGLTMRAGQTHVHSTCPTWSSSSRTSR